MLIKMILAGVLIIGFWFVMVWVMEFKREYEENECSEIENLERKEKCLDEIFKKI